MLSPDVLSDRHSDDRAYQRTAIVITSGGKRKPAKLDLGAGTRRERRRINPACLILLSTDATDRAALTWT